ncbi:hypothetical protein [Microvirga sp. TS319]|uniref:hypothetical protein n=1 Tax=Microvirga sp. TS319 TaxID=3241165 RepID=UPI00351A3258
MPDRGILGKHPNYPYTGIFVSTPGVDVSARNPTDRTGLALSSQWPVIANVIASGTCGLDEVVPYPSVVSGFRPYVHFQRRVGTGYHMHEMWGYNALELERIVAYEKCSRWRVVQTSSGFRIVKNARVYTDTIASASFRYVLFNLPVS